MKTSIATAFATSLLAGSLLATPAFALNYPVSGRYGLSDETKPGPIDCTGKRVIRFDGVQRFDSNGGVPEYRIFEMVQNGTADFRITEWFDTAQIRAQYKYTLRLVDSDRIELAMARGGTMKLKRCS
jgi:hypothetical protein